MYYYYICNMVRVKYRKLEMVDDIITATETHSKRVVSESVKIYTTAVNKKLMVLTTCERRLMDYFVQSMSDENLVHSNKLTWRSFNKHVYSNMYEYYKEIGLPRDKWKSEAENQMYSEGAISRAVTKLRSLVLIIQQIRGIYLVNPEYFYKRSERERMLKIEMMHTMEESDAEIDVKGYFKFKENDK